MNLVIRHGLPFAKTTLSFRGRVIEMENVLLDTGSGGSIFSVDKLLTLGAAPEPTDQVRRITGIGGSEYVYEKEVDYLAIGSLRRDAFKIQVGNTQYGLDFDGIVGTDFFIAMGAVIDFDAMTVAGRMPNEA